MLGTIIGIEENFVKMMNKHDKKFNTDEYVKFRPERGLSFKSKVDDISLIAEFNFFNYWTGSKRERITPYIFAGVSLLSFNSTDRKGNALQPQKNEGDYYSTLSWSVPFGIGVKYSISKRLGATLEWRIHKTFTDYIDDIKGYYKNDNSYDNNKDKEMKRGNGNSDGLDYYKYKYPKYKPKKQRGNGNSHDFGYNNDWYGILALTLSYRFNLPSRTVCHGM